MFRRTLSTLLSVTLSLVLVDVSVVRRECVTQEPVLQRAPAWYRHQEVPLPGRKLKTSRLPLSPSIDRKTPVDLRSQGNLAELPARWDWRDEGMVSPVKDQGDCYSSYAFAALGNFESRLLIDGADPYDFSENNAKECNWYTVADNGYGSCDGGHYDTIVSLLSTQGTVLEECDLYVDREDSCNSGCEYQKTLLGWGVIPQDPGSVPMSETLKSYIFVHGPVYAEMYVGDDGDDAAWWQEFWSYDGSYTLHYEKSRAPNHAVLIVGWDDSPIDKGDITGGWIVKNSWGTDWGDDGYFTIAYGSANIGMRSSFIYAFAWQDYDAHGSVLNYDEGGNSDARGWGGNPTAWGLVKFIPVVNSAVTHVEFWTSDVTSDVDVYLYDDFDGMAPSNLLTQKLNYSSAEAGYHSVALDEPIVVAGGDDVIVVVKFTNVSLDFPVVVDTDGPHETGRTYISSDGIKGSWLDLGLDPYYPADVAIRLRTSSRVLAVYIPLIARY